MFLWTCMCACMYTLRVSLCASHTGNSQRLQSSKLYECKILKRKVILLRAALCALGTVSNFEVCIEVLGIGKRRWVLFRLSAHAVSSLSVTYNCGRHALANTKIRRHISSLQSFRFAAQHTHWNTSAGAKASHLDAFAWHRSSSTEWTVPCKIR